MPWTENDNFLCGCAMKKNESGTWIRRFLVLDFSARVLKVYREDVEVSLCAVCAGRSLKCMRIWLDVRSEGGDVGVVFRVMHSLPLCIS